MTVQDHRTQKNAHFVVKQKAIIEPKKPEITFANYDHLNVLGNRVMIKILKVDFNKTESGILASSVPVQEAFMVGVIVVVGDGYVTAMGQQMSIPLCVGDVAFFDDVSGADYKIQRGEFEYEEVRLIDLPSIKYIDGHAKSLYTVGSLPKG